MAPPTGAGIDIPFWLETVAIAAGAIAGSVRGIRERLAVSGVVALAVALGLGGGIIRDTLLQNGPPVALQDSRFLPIALISGLPALLLMPVIVRLEWPVFVTDSVAIGIYSVLGADRALLAGIPPVGAVLVGVLAGTGGAILADLIVGTPPVLFRPGLLLGVAAAAGTVAYVVASELSGARAPWFVAGVVIVGALRITSAAKGWGVGPADRIAERSALVLRRGRQSPMPDPD